MMYRKFLLGGCFFLLFSTEKIQAQRIDSLLEVYDAKVPQEKIHIHFDNSQYTPKQTVWFKAYLMQGNEPSGLSKNFYLDWFTEQGKLLERTIMPRNRLIFHQLISGVHCIGNLLFSLMAKINK